MALQTAMQRLNNDRTFAEEAKKIIGYVPDAEVGADTNRQVRQTLVFRPDIKAFVAVYLKKAGR